METFLNIRSEHPQRKRHCKTLGSNEPKAKSHGELWGCTLGTMRGAPTARPNPIHPKEKPGELQCCWHSTEWGRAELKVEGCEFLVIFSCG